MRESIMTYFFIQGSGFRVQVAASPQKRKPTPPRCAQQPLPREGARVDAPSFLWKEVPRRGGGWRGKALSSTHSLPAWGRCPEGADRVLAVGKRASGIVSSMRYTRAPYPPLRGTPSPMGKAAKRGCRYPRHTPSPRREGAPKGRIGY